MKTWNWKAGFLAGALLVGALTLCGWVQEPQPDLLNQQQRLTSKGSIEIEDHFENQYGPDAYKYLDKDTHKEFFCAASLNCVEE